MKHLWISIGILAVLLCALLANNMHLKNLVEPMAEQLSQSSQLAKEDDWDQAKELLEKAQSHWMEQDAYLHTLLQHKEIDEVALLFQEAAQYLDCRKLGEFTAVNARLASQLNLICEMEQLSWHNIF